MADITNEDFPEASENERKRAPIGDLFNAEVDESERGQRLPPRRGEDVRDNVPGRYAAQGDSRWGRGEPGAEAVRKAAEEDARKALEEVRRKVARGPNPEEENCRESVPIEDTCFEARAHRALQGENVGASVDASSEESRRAAKAGTFEEGSPGTEARERMRGKGERED